MRTGYFFISLFVLIAPLFLAEIAFAQAATQPNFIFIVVDDLNDYVEGITDQPQVSTPNITALAESGTLFINAYANNPGCAPSRTSFLSGKDIDYTQVYNNEDYKNKFRENFKPEKNNAEVYTIPQILKDSGGYFTFCINKIFHNPTENDFDKTATPMCNKSKSWNRLSAYGDTWELLDLFGNYSFGDHFDWGMIPDSLEYLMEDVLAADTAIQFIDAYAAGTVNTCSKPFFLGLGISRPHSQRYIPEKYFPDYYLQNIYDEPFDKPYNDPPGIYPYNGQIMPPQPDTIFQDYYNLPEDGIARSFADNGKVYDDINFFVDGLSPLPEIDPGLTDEERKEILFQSADANYSIDYIAAVKFADAQVGRVLDALDAHPALKENTIIILIGDNGFSLGEKRHWTKWSIWETDLRVPFIIVDPSRPANQQTEATVSLLDLFPTICDLAGVAYPVFADGSDYLDGNSLIPLLDNPAAKIETPAVSTYKQHTTVGSCFSNYSVRNKRYHYIRYRKNNDGTFAISYCDSSYVGYEEELYDIGEERETDPYEWNNLIDDPEFAPVKDYLEEFMPGGNLYGEEAQVVEISNKAVPCFLNDHYTIKLKATLYSTAGAIVGGGALAGYQIKWTNSITGAVFYGTSYSFNTATIPAAEFAARDHIMFYCEVTELASGKVIAFDNKSIYINSLNTPNATFNLLEDEAVNSISIIDYSITGSYTNTYWNFADGFITEDFIPAIHYYAAPGIYKIRNFAEYGNGCQKIFTRTANLVREGVARNAYSVYPNPASNTLIISGESFPGNATIEVMNVLGQIVFMKTISHAEGSTYLDVKDLADGTYILRISGENAAEVSQFEVIH